MTENIRCEIYCQKEKNIYAEIPLNTGEYEKDGIHIKIHENMVNGCRLGELSLHIKNTSNMENFNLRTERPVRTYLPMEQPEKMTAMYMFNPWWTRPAFAENFQKIPDRTQVLFLKYKDYCACMVPVVGRKFKTYITGGTETEICLETTAGLGGISSVEEPLYLITEAPSIYEAIHKAFSWLADYKGIRMREERRIPEVFRYLGWCSWDAFYRKVSESGVRQKAEELYEKNVPVKWMVIDDGWMTMDRNEELLVDFKPDPKKFPKGFRKMTEDLKETNGIRWMGVWHAMGGFWGGVLPESALAQKEAPYLYQTVSGKLVPSPVTGERFYRDWYEQLNREGISFVKVDGQSSAAWYFENSLPLAEAVRGMNEALESGASRMDGAVINCMGMAMENILARPATAISRNSDDFVPDKEGGFAEHLLQNAYNALYHNELYCCDWDMFWTMHKDAMKHSLLRAVSGGPVYVSDKPGATDPDILKPLMYLDGEILMMDRSAKPTEDCAFSDPLTDGVLKLHNTAPYGDGKAGGIAAYNLTDRKQLLSFIPADIPDLDQADTYRIYDYFGKKAVSLGRYEKYESTMEAGGYGWFVILPCTGNCSCLGLVDKYAGFTAAESIHESENTMTAVIRETGRTGWISEKEPAKVMVNGVDVTDNVEKQGNVYTVDVPENPEKMILSVNW